MNNIHKIITVIGARPQFIKAAVVSRELKKRNDLVEVIIHTGQHYDENMSKVFFEELEISEPKYNLGISNLSHGTMTGRMMEKIERVVLAEDPDIILVYGDTNSTLAGALVGKKLHIRIVHVEAGLRSFDDRMPEEINRILTDRVSNLLFCPTQTAVDNLRREGYESFNCQIINSGDVMYDAVLNYQDKVRNSTQMEEKFRWLPDSPVLCTVHRAENTDSEENLKAIFNALDIINKDHPVILPIHPRTLKLLSAYQIETSVKLIEPVSYLEMLFLLDKCRMVMTDSGGLQKEAFFSRKICITLRETTEWRELIEHGVNFLVGSDEKKIVETYQNCIRQDADFSVSLYGDGNAGRIIVDNLLN